MDQADQKALSQLGPLLLREINIDVLQPYLGKYDLTTSEELGTLLSESLSNINKKKKLIYLWLPQKGKDAFDKFIKALQESNEAGTTHGKLADKLLAERSRTEGIAVLNLASYLRIACILPSWILFKRYSQAV